MPGTSGRRKYVEARGACCCACRYQEKNLNSQGLSIFLYKVTVQRTSENWLWLPVADTAAVARPTVAAAARPTAAVVYSMFII
jgi:hypothetical protein